MNQGLASWFTIWHERYRGILVQLAVAAALAAGLVFVQQTFLNLLTLSLAPNAPTSSAGPVSDLTKVPASLSNLAASLGIDLPFVLLGLFLLAMLLVAAIDYWKSQTGGRLKVRAQDDMEAEILTHLLRKDDTFFARHSPAETVNRLAVDLYRVGSRRTGLMQVWWSALMIVGSLTFFVWKDWRLALVAMAGCVAGALWARYMTRHVKQIDADYLRHDDRVKSSFEDFLRASPEVQVGHLYEKIRTRFREVQEERTKLYVRYVRLSGLLNVGGTVSYLLTFLAMLLVTLYMQKTGNIDPALGLVPVIIMALPMLFENASSLVFLNLEFDLAHSSMKRLLEYEARESRVSADAAAPGSAPDASRPEGERPTEPIRIESASYQYTDANGTPQGGIAETTTTFAPGKWTTVVGGAGSGKSTVLKFLLGRLKPQGGSVAYGQTPLDALDHDQLARLFSIMPQSPALLNSTIEENLLFGKADGGPGGAVPAGLSDSDLDVIERLGLGKICRLKGLDRPAGIPADHAALKGNIAGLRRRVRERLHDACDAAVLPYEDGHSDRRHWVSECLTGGRCDRRAAARKFLGKAGEKVLGSFPDTELGAELMEHGRSVLRATRGLLAIDNFHVYAQLAPFPIDEEIWALRSTGADLAEREPSNAKEKLALCRVALTATPAESSDAERSERWGRPDFRTRFPAQVRELRALLGDAHEPFAPDAVNSCLTWRENLVFGVVDVRNSRAGGHVDNVLLESVEEEGLKDAFTRLGLQFEIGRLGGNLSGGQGQLVALCRAVLRRTPVLVLDEPTSSLDPESRARVAQFLRSWRSGRIVITVSHDPEFVKESDEVKLMDGGRLIASGTFQELEAGSEIFRKTLRQT